MRCHAKVCRYCGHRLDLPPLPDYAKWIVAAGVVVLVISFIFIGDR